MQETPTPIAEIQHSPSTFEQFLNKNMKALILALVAIFLFIVAGAWLLSLGSLNKSNAGEALLSADTIQDLAAVTTNYPNSQAALSAQLLQARLETDTASKNLQKLVNPSSESVVSTLASIDLAKKLIQQKKYQNAKKMLQEVKISQTQGFVSPVIDLLLGDVAALEGDIASARSSYTALSNLQNLDSQTAKQFAAFISISNERLRTLNTKPPRVTNNK